jgi:hypothetical protein
MLELISNDLQNIHFSHGQRHSGPTLVQDWYYRANIGQ